MRGETQGWIVTYCHGEDQGAWADNRQVEARLAVMPGQWGWAVYATTTCKAHDTIGWYDGERISVEQWQALNKYNGKEHMFW